ncbi:MAG: DUF4012 domain-containing protein [Actinobacteria bacterium]|nr:DUF4012 domain-containing protein [Actinomycetota bacterium]
MITIGVLRKKTNQDNSSRVHRTKDNRAKRKNTRLLLLVLVILLALTATIAGRSIVSDLLGVQKWLINGQDSLRSAYIAAEKGEFDKSQLNFEQAQNSFMDAGIIMSKPGVTMLAIVPVANSNLEAVRRLTEAGIEVAYAGEALTQASTKFSKKQGKFDISIDNGMVDIKPFIEAQPDIDRAHLHVLQAMAAFDKIPDGYLIPQIKSAKKRLGEELPTLKTLVSKAKVTFDVLPGVMGGEGKRRYFLAIQNNAELRATGGLIGNYGLLTVDNGAIKLDEFDEILAIDNPAKPIDAPEDFAARYSRFEGARIWSNVNMSPDFPTVSRVLLKFFESVRGEKLDGVITIDPVGLSYLLDAIGPLTLADTGVTIDSGNAVEWTLVKAYKDFPQRDTRKDFLADIAQAVWGRIITGQVADKSKLVEQFGLALSEKHMALYSTDESEQKIAESLGYAGELMPTTNDYLQVVMQNHGANKVDIYMHQEIKHTIDLRPDGSGLATLSIDISNKTPASGLPTYVTGENSLGAKGGLSNTWLSVYVPKGAQLLSAKLDGEAGVIEINREKDKTVFSRYVKVPPGANKVVELSYELPYVLVFDKSGIDYRFDWQAQPVINKPTVTSRVTLPDGFAISELPDGFARKGHNAAYSGTLSKDKSFDFGLIDNR